MATEQVVEAFTRLQTAHARYITAGVLAVEDWLRQDPETRDARAAEESPEAAAAAAQARADEVTLSLLVEGDGPIR